MNDARADIAITPETKVGAMLDAYPQAEKVLIELAPAFAKLRNPVLRKTVAKITTLRQAARVGGVSLSELINRLREVAGVAGVKIAGGGSIFLPTESFAQRADPDPTFWAYTMMTAGF